MRAARKKNPSAAQAARHTRILDETKRLMSEIGADQMTVRDLAAASGVAPGTVYNRFGSKDQVISLAVLDHYEKVIRGRLDDYKTAKTPLEKLLLGLNLIADDCYRGRAFATALMSTYFKVSSEPHQLQSLYQALYSTWFPIVDEMQQRGFLRPWVIANALCVELCDREFGVVIKWVQGDIPNVDIRDRSTFAVLSILLGASRGKQATQIEETIEMILKRTAKSYL